MNGARKLLCCAMGTLALATLSGCKMFGFGSSSSMVRYRVAKVSQGEVEKTVSATGTLTPWTVVDIKSRAGGRIDNLPVHLGTIVTKGQLLAQIDPSDTLLTYNQARADIASGQSQVDQAENSLKLQKTQTQVGIATAEANLRSAIAAAAAAEARYHSAQAAANSQGALTDASIASAKATLQAQQAKLTQMISATVPQTRAQAGADLGQAKANLVNADLQLKRQKALLAKGFVAQSAVDQAQATRDVNYAAYETALKRYQTLAPELDQDVAAQQAQVAQAQAALNNAVANSVQVKLQRSAAQAARADAQQADAQIAQARANLQQAKAQVLNNQVKLAQIQQAGAAVVRGDAEMSNAKVQLHDTNVTAPSNGIILQKYVEQGTFITSGMSFNSSGTSIVQLGDISRMYIDTAVDETDIANIEMGQKVDVTFDAYPTVPFSGKVVKIDPQEVVNSNVTTLHVRVEVDNSDITYRLLKPGMNATCDFVVGRKENVVMVPNEAVQSAPDGSNFVMVAIGGQEAKPDKGAQPDPRMIEGCKLEKRTIQVGLQGDDDTEIVSGVKPGDMVVTQTIQPLPPGPGGLGGR